MENIQKKHVITIPFQFPKERDIDSFYIDIEFICCNTYG